MTDIINEIYNIGDISEYISRSIFKAMPKKPGTKECELYRSINLTSHIIKMLIQILTNRARVRVKPDEPCGFMKNMRKGYATFIS